MPACNCCKSSWVICIAGTTIQPRLNCHLNSVGIDRVSVLETPRAKPNRLLVILGRARVHRNRHAELARSRYQNLDLLVEPCHTNRIVPGTEIAPGVVGLDQIACEGMLAAYQGFETLRAVGDSRDRYIPSKIIKAAEIAMACAGAEVTLR